MKEKNKSLLYLAAVIVVLALLIYTTLVGWQKGHRGSAKNIKLGLDLAGGVSITYEANKANPTETEMSDTIEKMQRRAEAFSTEAAVYQEGTNRITVDIPGVDDAEAVLQSLGRAGSLEFVAADQMNYDEEGKPQYEKYILNGSGVKNAEGAQQQDSTTGLNEYVVSLTFTGKGAKKFAKATRTAVANGNEPIYIVYDGEIISAPSVQNEITNGEAVISGSFKTMEDANELATLIRIGALPLELHEIRSNVVGAQLGLDAIDSSLLAGAIGFALVILFMIILYRIPGVASAIALVFYLAAVLVTLNVLDITLTLPGVAGIILNIGMAVDANVIIFTRIREELADGKSVQSSIQSGFSKALSAIVDGNITTLIAAAVLYAKGSGTVKGFATTLAIGIVLSMFTALCVTRWIMNALYHMGVDDVKYFGVEKKRNIIHFVENRVKFFVISGCLIIACVVALLVNQNTIGNILNYGLDFQGGTSVNITFNDDTKIDTALKEDIEKIVSDIAQSNDIVISDVSDANTLNVKTIELSEEQRNTLTDKMVSEYQVEEQKIEMETISASVSSEMRRDAIIAVLIAAVFMLIYIWIRFKDLTFAGSAVLALLHDVVVVLLVYAVFRISVGNTFIACMLTIVGYSINATIVIFDRIRENLGSKRSREALANLVNESITQTLSRSINTSLTTFFMVVVLAILGVESVKEFAIPLMAGIICGAYSSVCITGTLWYVVKGIGSKSK